MKTILIILTVIAIVGSLVFGISVWTNFNLLGNLPVDWGATGQVGDFYGGIIGTVVSAMGFILIYQTFQSQNNAQDQQRIDFDKTFKAQEKAQEKQREEFEKSFQSQLQSQKQQKNEFDKNFELQQIAQDHQRSEFLKSQTETRFFELIRLHRENLFTIEYEIGPEKIKDRKAIKLIIEQFEMCYKEIKPFFIGVSPQDIYSQEYLVACSSIKQKRKDIDLLQFARVDIAYSVVFYGVSEKDVVPLTNLLTRYYDKSFVENVLDYLSLKKTDMDSLSFWLTVREHERTSAFITTTIKGLKELRSRYVIPAEHNFMTAILDLMDNRSVEYYGGHQYKLGHYFRHLYQTVKYINSQKNLSYDEKYDYIKILRAQLSTAEQYLLLYNSLSFMGREWDFNHLEVGDAANGRQLFTKYNLIKNIPDLLPLGEIDVRYYYPWNTVRIRKRSSYQNPS